MNKWLMLKKRIEIVLDTLRKTLEKNKLYDDCCNDINIFLESYKSGNPNFELLSIIPDDIIDRNQKQQFIENYKLKKEIEGSLFLKTQLNQSNVIIEKFINSLFMKYKSLINESQKRNNYSNVLEDTISLYDKAYFIIDDKGLSKSCNQSILNVIIDEITELGLEESIKLEMIQELKEANEKLINNPKEETEKDIDKIENSASVDINLGDDKEPTKDNLIIKGTKIIGEVEEIIEYFEPILENYYDLNIDTQKYTNIYTRIEYLKELISDYNESLSIYIKSNETDDEAIKYFYKELNDSYGKLLKEKKSIETKNTMDDNGDFYVPMDKLKNVIVFIPINDLEVSNMEESLSNDENIQNSDYNSIKLALNRLLI